MRSWATGCGWPRSSSVGLAHTDPRGPFQPQPLHVSTIPCLLSLTQHCLGACPTGSTWPCFAPPLQTLSVLASTVPPLAHVRRRGLVVRDLEWVGEGGAGVGHQQQDAGSKAQALSFDILARVSLPEGSSAFIGL